MYKYHLLAIATVIIWGVTFVSTKVLINNGLSPVEILVYRFALAYLCIWTVCPRRLFAGSIKDELLCVVVGMGGGSMYFLFENTALGITQASNVSLIICTSPILTAFLTRLFYPSEKIRTHLIAGSVIALAGVTLVVLNGSYELKLNPLGDMLTVLAALSWGFYSVALRSLNTRYHTLFITRKVFFYGILTILPFAGSPAKTFHPELLIHPTVLANVAFLGIAASLLCYVMWNNAVKRLGVVPASNYIYFIPVVTLLVSAYFLNERMTVIALLGAALILAGVYVAEKKGTA